MATKLARKKATRNLIENLLPLITFMAPLDNSIICLLCNTILKNPWQLSCGHRVCKMCDEEFIAVTNGTRYCQEDGELIETSFPDMSALVEIMHLECHCLAVDDGCTWQGMLLDLEEHVVICEFNKQMKCPYADFNCLFTGNRRNMDEHFVKAFKKHDTLVATCLRELLNGMKENNNSFDLVKGGISDVKRSVDQILKESPSLQRLLNETEAMVIDTNMRCTNLKEQLSKIEELLKTSTSKKEMFVSFQNKFEELLKNVEKQEHMLSFPNTKKDEDNRQLVIDKVNTLGEVNTTNSKHLNDVTSKLRIFQCSSTDGTYTWKLDKLRNRFTEALSGKVNELYTPPLYTSRFGYKYSCKVMLYGTKHKDQAVDNNIQHLSFYIVLMQGDWDDLLMFPFPYPISVSLLNTSKKDHITHTLYPDPNKAHFQKPWKNMNPAIGFSRFCSHDRLYSGGFVKNDSIYFEVNVNKVGIDVREPDI